jgi:hypothetical protein
MVSAAISPYRPWQISPVLLLPLESRKTKTVILHILYLFLTFQMVMKLNSNSTSKKHGKGAKQIRIGPREMLERGKRNYKPAISSKERISKP